MVLGNEFVIVTLNVGGAYSSLNNTLKQVMDIQPAVVFLQETRKPLAKSVNPVIRNWLANLGFMYWETCFDNELNGGIATLINTKAVKKIQIRTIQRNE